MSSLQHVDLVIFWWDSVTRRSVATKVDEMDRPEKLRRVVHEMTPVTPSKEMGRWMEDRI